ETSEKASPPGGVYHERRVRLLHGAARVLLRPAGGPADHLRDEIFEACRWNTMMGLVYLRVRIKARINHDPVDEIIHDGGDAVDTADALIKPGRILSSHRLLLLLRHAVRRSLNSILSQGGLRCQSRPGPPTFNL